eukprot:475277_1
MESSLMCDHCCQKTRPAQQQTTNKRHTNIAFLGRSNRVFNEPRCMTRVYYRKSCKCGWSIMTTVQNDSGDSGPPCGAILRSAQISSSDFLRKFLLKNRPLILTNATSGWNASDLWVSDEGTPNFAYLLENFGVSEVCITNCTKDHCTLSLKMSEFLTYWEERTDSQDVRYMKDWHLVKEYPDYNAYEVPVPFRDDWMNFYWDYWSRTSSETHDDFRFCYMGPRGSWTGLHADVFRSYSWSANACGRKLWIMFPPDQTKILKKFHGASLPESVLETWAQATGLCISDLPEACEGVFIVDGARAIYCVQESGDAIFVPSGWFHEVHNLEDTISINHNWANAFNVDHLWSEIHSQHLAVCQEIHDCMLESGPTEEWRAQCERMLKALAGINLQEFYNFMLVCAKREICGLNCSTKKHRCEFCSSIYTKSQSFPEDDQKENCEKLLGIDEDYLHLQKDTNLVTRRLDATQPDIESD